MRMFCRVEIAAVLAASLLLCIIATGQGVTEKEEKSMPYILQNSHLRLEFSDGCLTSFVSLRTNDNYLKATDKPGPLFAATVEGPNGLKVKAVPGSIKCSIEDNKAVLRASSFRIDGEKVAFTAEVCVELVPDKPESRWTIHLTNHDASRTISSVTFPNLDGVRLGANWQDDALYLPFVGGERFLHAVQDFVDIFEGPRPGNIELGNTARISKEGDRYINEITYAGGGASMMWLDYADGAEGLYVASHDPEFQVTDLCASTAGPAAGGMNFSFSKQVSIAPGGQWQSAPFIVAAHDGDWHWAADQYRAWFLSVVPLTFHGGAWREVLGGWLAFLKPQDGTIRYTFADLPKMYDRVVELGMDLMIPYGWSFGGYDTLDPVYYPDLELGGPMEMARAHQDIRNRGGHIMTYMNGRIFNHRCLYFDTLGEAWAIKKPDGTKYTEQYGEESFAVMCPGAEGWRNLLADFGEMLVRFYGTDLVYYDQVAMGGPYGCFNAAHGHQENGAWNRNSVGMLKQLNERCRAANPDVALAIEGVADIYTPYVLFQSSLPLFHTGGTRFYFPELYKYTIPEAIISTLIFFTEKPTDPTFSFLLNLPQDTAAELLCRAIMTGQMLAFVDPLLEEKTWKETVRGLLAIKKAAAPWTGRGVFRDTVDIVSVDVPLEAKTFRWDQGPLRSVLVMVYNPECAAGLSVTMSAEGLSNVKGYRLIAPDQRQPLDYSMNGTNVTFTAPPDLLSVYILEGEM